MTSSDRPAALVARGLKKSFQKTVAVQHLDLRLEYGECLALLGPNGAGKTTTVEMLEGLVVPDAGEVLLLGDSLARNRRQLMERVGVLLQDTSLYKRYTVRETLTLFASFFAKPLSPEVVMERLALQDKAGAQLRQLSGGQKQRVYLGCALINNPELLFLDEPTTGLDPQARRALWDLILGLKAEGKSVLLTTHYLEEAEVLADRVAIMDHGKIIADGTPRQLIEGLGGEQVVRLTIRGDAFGPKGLDDATIRHQLTAALPWFDRAKSVDGGYELVAANAPRHVTELFQVLPQLGLEVANLEVRRGTLEDVFLQLTGRSLRDA